MELSERLSAHKMTRVCGSQLCTATVSTDKRFCFMNIAPHVLTNAMQLKLQYINQCRVFCVRIGADLRNYNTTEYTLNNQNHYIFDIVTVS